LGHLIEGTVLIALPVWAGGRAAVGAIDDIPRL
jgi:hypothetical protein